MFTHLLVFLVTNGVFAGSPNRLSTASATPVHPELWPGETDVLVTIHGMQHQAPHSGQACVYVEWTRGHNVNKNGKDDWLSFDHPTASRTPLVFRSVGKDPLHVHPGIVRFFLSPSFEGTAPAAKLGPDSDVVSPIVKEFCLREGQSVYLRRTQVVHGLPPESDAETPQTERHEGFVVSTTEGERTLTPASMLR